MIYYAHPDGSRAEISESRDAWHHRLGWRFVCSLFPPGERFRSSRLHAYHLADLEDKLHLKGYAVSARRGMITDTQRLNFIFDHAGADTPEWQRFCQALKDVDPHTKDPHRAALDLAIQEPACHPPGASTVS